MKTFKIKGSKSFAEDYAKDRAWDVVKINERNGVCTIYYN